MTEIQELLLDKLVAASFGPNWTDGPFRVAAELLPGKPIVFKGRHDDTPAKNAIATRLGYPRLLLEAAQGVVWLLANEDDRRAFAIAVIRSIPPGAKPKRSSSALNWRAAATVTRRAHQLVCPSAECEVTAALGVLLVEDGEHKAVLDEFFETAHCPTYANNLDEAIRITRQTPALDRTIHAACDCVYSFSGNEVLLYSNRAAREAARAVYQVGGLEEAVAVCVELAKLLGMETG